MSGWTTRLLTGLAEHLAAAGIADWDPNGTYPAAPPRPVIVFRALPDKPDRVIALAMYGDVDLDDAGLNDVVAAVQVRTRGTTDPRDADDIADAVWELLHGAEMLRLGTGPDTVATTLIRRRSSALLGQDAAGRWERTDNYYVAAARPNAHRPD